MYRIRFHGRGGQGIKTAGRVLGTALFINGYEVQDAPRYGAERRGAPIFAYVRACKERIYERGVIHHPDLVVVADDSLVPVPASGVMAGVDRHTVVLINSDVDQTEWADRLGSQARIVSLPLSAGLELQENQAYLGMICAGAAAALLGIISESELMRAVEEELDSFAAQIIEKNKHCARDAYLMLRERRGMVHEGKAASLPVMGIELEQKSSAESHKTWMEPPFDSAANAGPAILAQANSVQVRTGLWRTWRPVIDYDRCSGCWWVCSTFCPDGAIKVQERRPVIDYDHCKGCMICVAQCPPHAIEAYAEHEFTKEVHS